MTQLTVRGIDPHLHDALKREAQRQGQSVNRYVLDLLREALETERLPDQSRIRTTSTISQALGQQKKPRHSMHTFGVSASSTRRSGREIDARHLSLFRLQTNW